MLQFKFNFIYKFNRIIISLLIRLISELKLSNAIIFISLIDIKLLRVSVQYILILISTDKNFDNLLIR
jgi:hypothetical protein